MKKRHNLRLMVKGEEMDGVVSIDDMLQYVYEKQWEAPFSGIAHRAAFMDMLEAIFEVDEVTITEQTIKTERDMQIYRVVDGVRQTGVILRPSMEHSFEYMRTDASARGEIAVWFNGESWYDADTNKPVAP